MPGGSGRGESPVSDDADVASVRTAVVNSHWRLGLPVWLLPFPVKVRKCRIFVSKPGVSVCRCGFFRFRSRPQRVLVWGGIWPSVAERKGPTRGLEGKVRILCIGM